MNIKYINLTLQPATPEQVAAGVVDFDPQRRQALCELLTFHEIPSWIGRRARAVEISDLIQDSIRIDCHSSTFKFMVDGPLFFMNTLCKVLKDVHSIECVCAFTKAEHITDPTTGRTETVLKHKGFVPYSMD